MEFTVHDKNGLTNTIIKQITVLFLQEYVKLKIYNSAGELVRVINADKTSINQAALKVSDVVIVGNGNTNIQVEYAQGQFISWDGNNSQGRTVDSGVYVMNVEVSTANGLVIMASKNITIINAKTTGGISDVKIYPNPFMLEGASVNRATIKWTASGQGIMKVYIYNMAGELIRKIETDLLSSSVDWDLKTLSGKNISSGIYIVVLQANKVSGETSRETLKFTIVKKF